MAVCNLFNELTSPSGNFLMFSQYVEDITHNFTEDDNWKVVPTGFVALDIDYSKIDKRLVLNDYKETLNTGIPKYFQNYFENACAYGRSKTNWDGLETNGWNPGISRNLFWNSMFKGKFIHAEKYGSESSDVKYIPEVKYFGSIDMQSYNEHKGMGYNEIYCYIPSNAPRMHCQVIADEDVNFDTSNSASTTLEGYPNINLEGYPTTYYFDRNYKMNFDDDSINNLLDGSETKFDINTIVVLYSIYVKKVTSENPTTEYETVYNSFEEEIIATETNQERIENAYITTTDWELIHYNLPMGMYITGIFDANNKLTNSVKKYVSTSFNTGTSYGLRICNRFSATSNGTLFNTEVIVDDSSYASLCKLMYTLNENLSMMLDNTKVTGKLIAQYKELESRLQNQRMNVPYVKTINGVDYWFVNGKMLSSVHYDNAGINQLSPSTIQQRLDNLSDDDLTNDYTYIEDTNGPNYEQVDPAELADKLGLYDIMDDMNT